MSVLPALASDDIHHFFRRQVLRHKFQVLSHMFKHGESICLYHVGFLVHEQVVILVENCRIVIAVSLLVHVLRWRLTALLAIRFYLLAWATLPDRRADCLRSHAIDFKSLRAATICCPSRNRCHLFWRTALGTFRSRIGIPGSSSSSDWGLWAHFIYGTGVFIMALHWSSMRAASFISFLASIAFLFFVFGNGLVKH